MILIAALLLGAFLGWRRAASLGGNRKDQAQYAAAFALAFAVVALFLTIALERLAG